MIIKLLELHWFKQNKDHKMVQEYRTDPKNQELVLKTTRIMKNDQKFERTT